jgi:predicted O-methyltransferase YrrM
VDALERVEAIPGWLQPGDAEKLYELARLTPGPILEIGTHHGKSAVLMALALKDARRHDVVLHTLDVDRTFIRAAAAEAKAREVDDVIVFVRGTLRAFARAYPHLRPPLTFIDGDHTRAGVERDLEVLDVLVPAGGSLLFHDFADPRNDDPDCPETKVRPAVETSWVARECDFGGTFGVCGLFVRRETSSRARADVADLLSLESWKDQVHYRLRYPAARLVRALTSTDSGSRSDSHARESRG